MASIAFSFNLPPILTGQRGDSFRKSLDRTNAVVICGRTGVAWARWLKLAAVLRVSEARLAEVNWIRHES
jgi:hypothetical protein